MKKQRKAYLMTFSLGLGLLSMPAWATEETPLPAPTVPEMANSPQPNIPTGGSQRGIQEDKETLKAARKSLEKQKRVVKEDREKLGRDTQQLGENSPQVKADREQLQKDRNTLKEMRKRMKNARQALQRSRRHRHHG